MKPFGDLRYRGRVRRYRKVIGSVLAQYGIRDARVTFLRDLDNTTFRVDSLSKAGQERFLLRIHTPHPRGWAPIRHSYLGIRSELEWLSALRRDTNLVVPEPIPNQGGDFITEMAVEGLSEPRLCTLLRWMPGRFVDKRRMPDHCLKLGILSAKLHRHAEQWELPTSFARPRWDEKELLNRLSQLHSATQNSIMSTRDFKTFEEYTERAVEVMRKLGQGRAVFGIIHHDLHRRNYIFYKGEVHPIDFDTCGLGYYFYDLVAPLYHLSPAQRRAFFEGYQSVQELPDGYEHYVETFFVMLLTRLYTSDIRWAIEKHKRPASPQPPELMQKYLQGEPFLFNFVADV